MKRLLLLRHAKSSWDHKVSRDFDRPLNDRGQKAAARMGSLIADEGLIPDIIISSPAQRAHQTTETAMENAGYKGDVVFDDRVYEADTATLLDIVNGLDGEYTVAMLVGHNPGIEGLLRLLTADQEPMPTAALAVIDLDVMSWPDIKPGSGVLRSFFRPKDLL